MASPDDELVRRLKAGQRDAFEQVIADHYHSVFRQHWHLCGDRDLAADLTQDTFVQTWKSLASFGGRSTLRTWITTIALRVWHRARSGRHIVLALDDLTEDKRETYFGGDDPHDLAAAHITRGVVQAAVLRLPAPQSEAVVLFYIQQMSYQEIAEAQGVPIGTVKSRLHEALRRLKPMLSDLEVFGASS